VLVDLASDARNAAWGRVQAACQQVMRTVFESPS
jgi:hypothetical protein